MKDQCIICENWEYVEDLLTDGAERFCRACWEEYLPDILKNNKEIQEIISPIFL